MSPAQLLLRPIMPFLLITIGISLLSYKFIEFPQRGWRYLLRWEDRQPLRAENPSHECRQA
jgi:peptidoglycan/LPS O-acetylase OafA/YrhL